MRSLSVRNHWKQHFFTAHKNKIMPKKGGINGHKKNRTCKVPTGFTIARHGHGFVRANNAVEMPIRVVRGSVDCRTQRIGGNTIRAVEEGSNRTRSITVREDSGVRDYSRNNQQQEK
jgi:hypothetical protein